MPGIYIGNRIGKSSSSYWTTQSKVLFDRMKAVSSEPTYVRKRIIDASIKSDVANLGFDAFYDALWLLASHGESASLLNIVKDSHNITKVSTPVFTVDRGFTGVPASNTALKTNYNPSLHAALYGRDNASFGVYIRNDIDGSFVISANSGLNLIPKSSNTSYYNINGGNEFAVDYNSRGMWIVSRTAHDEVKIYHNGVLLKTTAGESEALINSIIYLLGRNIGVDDLYSYSPYQISLAFVGKGMSAADVVNFQNNWVNGYLKDIFASPALALELDSVQTGAVVNVQINYNISTSDYPAIIEWGDGKISVLITDGVNRSVQSSYASSNQTYKIKLYCNPSDAKKIDINNTTVTLNIDQFAEFSTLEYLSLYNLKTTCTGSINNLPQSLITLILYSITTIDSTDITGSIDNLSPNITDLTISYCGKGYAGSIDNLSSGLLKLNLQEFHSVNIIGNTNNLASGLTELTFINAYPLVPDTVVASIVGDLDNLPVGLTRLSIENIGTNWTGSINNLPNTLTYLWLERLGTAITGSINNIPSGITNLTLYRLFCTITGNVENLNAGCTNIEIRSCGAGVTITYGGGATKAWASATIIRVQTAMASATVDALIIALAASVTGTLAATYTFQNARTAASDAAVSTLAGKNKTIVTSN